MKYPYYFIGHTVSNNIAGSSAWILLMRLESYLPIKIEQTTPQIKAYYIKKAQ